MGFTIDALGVVAITLIEFYTSTIHIAYVCKHSSPPLSAGIVQTMPNRQVATTGGGGEHKVRNVGRVTEFSHYWGMIKDANFSAQMQTFGLKSKAHYSGGHTPCWYTCTYCILYASITIPEMYYKNIPMRCCASVRAWKKRDKQLLLYACNGIGTRGNNLGKGCAWAGSVMVGVQ